MFAQYTVEVDDRDAVQDKLKETGIPTAVHYPMPLHLQPAFANLNLGHGAFPMSEQAAERVISLPMHPFISIASQIRVLEALRFASRS